MREVMGGRGEKRGEAEERREGSKSTSSPSMIALASSKKIWYARRGIEERERREEREGREVKGNEEVHMAFGERFLTLFSSFFFLSSSLPLPFLYYLSLFFF